MNEHQDEFGITNINTNMDDEEEIEQNPWWMEKII